MRNKANGKTFYVVGQATNNGDTLMTA